jgi:hypothetical protein
VHGVDDVALLQARGPAVHGHLGGRADVARGIAHDLAVHGHAAREDELLGGAPGRDAGVGEELGEPHGGLTLRRAATLRRTSDREASR